MNNKSKIKGNKNFVIQGNRDSNIKIDDENNKSLTKRNYTLIGIIIGIIGLIVTIIIGWDNIINFFTK